MLAMKLTLLLVFVVLLSSTAEPKKGGIRGASFATTLRHFHRLVLLFKGRIEELFIESVPLINRLAADQPQYADQINGIMQAISEVYNSDRFWYLSDYLTTLHYVIMKPIISAQDGCVQSANDKIVEMLQPSDSAFDNAVQERLEKVRQMITNAVPKFELSMDLILDLLEDAIKQGAKCQQKSRSTSLVACAYDALVPLVNDLSSLSEDPDFNDFNQEFWAIFSEIASAGGNLEGLVQAVLKDAWATFVFCEESSFRKEESSKVRSYRMMG